MSRTEYDRLSEYDRHWYCSMCLSRFVVPCLARDCERRHALRLAKSA